MFVIEGYLDFETKFDPRFVKGLARLVEHKDNEHKEIIIPYHKCTSRDFEMFPMPSSDSKALYDVYKEGKRSLFCLDWDANGDDLTIWGEEHDLITYQRFEFNLVPCNYVHPNTDDIRAEECIEDRLAQENYLRNM